MTRAIVHDPQASWIIFMRQLHGDHCAPATSAEENRIARTQVKAAKQVGNSLKLRTFGGRALLLSRENDLFIHLLCIDAESACAFLHGAHSSRVNGRGPIKAGMLAQ